MTRKNRLSTIFLRPGELSITKDPALITAVLGSCISLTIYFRKYGLSGICHAVLPQADKDNGFRYVDCAFRYMFDTFEQQGVNRADMEVRLFGGADMLTTAGENSGMDVGRLNLETAYFELERAGLELKEADVRGTMGRKLLFFSHTGEVTINPVAPPAIVI